MIEIYQKNMANYKLIIFVLFFIFSGAYSQNLEENIQSFQISETTIYEYKKPKLFEVIKYLPKDIIEFGQFTVQKENILWTGLAVGSTAAIIPFDQMLLDNAIEIGEPLGLNTDARYKRLFGVLELIPRDLNAGIYFLGNGLTTLIIGGGFYTAGKINNDYRALNTANELVEVLISVGVTTQTLKRITGRQSPTAAIDDGNPGGHWTPFPSFKSYQTNTPNYDAMPSGHIATFMATITVIATNYPEVKWIKPVGYSLMGILAFEMVSSRVHWVSDYPIGLLIGYAIGKNAANRRIMKKIKTDVTGEVIQPKFKTDFNFRFDSHVKAVGVTITF
jgi:hypothetical protein